MNNLSEAVICTDRSKPQHIVRGDILYCGGQIPMFQSNMLPASSARIFTIVAKTTFKAQNSVSLLFYFGIDDSGRFAKC